MATKIFTEFSRESDRIYTKRSFEEIYRYINTIQECLLEINLLGKIQKDTYKELSENVKKIRKELGIPLDRRCLLQNNKKEERASSHA
jgi:hypothetical protein